MKILLEPIISGGFDLQTDNGIYWCYPFLSILLGIHETEIKQFGNRNGRNRVEIISTLGHKSRIVETDYEGRNELRGSKRITRIETNYEGQNEL